MPSSFIGIILKHFLYFPAQLERVKDMYYTTTALQDKITIHSPYGSTIGIIANVMRATVARRYVSMPTRLAEALTIVELVPSACAVVDVFDALRMLEIFSSPSTRTNAMPLH
jgi:hypothetical protein